MDKNDLDIQDSDLKEEDFTPEELEAEDVDWKGKSQELKGIAKRRATQLSKAKERLTNLEKELGELKTNVPHKKESQSDNELLNRVDKLALQVAGITEDDETELFNQWKTDTGRGAETIVSNNIFKKELEQLRTNKANAKAAAGFKGGGGTDETKLSPAYWKERGEPPTPEEVPDRKARVKIMNEIINEKKGRGIKFYNQK